MTRRQLKRVTLPEQEIYGGDCSIFVYLNNANGDLGDDTNKEVYFFHLKTVINTYIYLISKPRNGIIKHIDVVVLRQVQGPKQIIKQNRDVKLGKIYRRLLCK